MDKGQGFSDDEISNENHDDIIYSNNSNDIINNNIEEKKIEKNDIQGEILYDHSLLIIDPMNYDYNIQYQLLLTDNIENDDNYDSDSSLEAYDLIEDDSKVGKEKRPIYLKDCLDGLKETENIDKRDAALLSLKNILKNNPIGIEKYCVQLLISLLNCREEYCLDNFIEIRHENLVNIIVLCPTQTVPILIKEFYSLEKDIQYRIDILSILTDSAKELSDIKTRTIEDDNNNSKSVKQVGKVIKRFYHPKKQKSTKNPYLKYSDLYFIPLIYGVDHKNRQIDILNKDPLLLSKLITSLGILLECSYNGVNILQYSSLMIDVILVCRYHKEPDVRFSVLFSLSRVVIVTPQQLIQIYLSNQIIELSEWISYEANYDPDPRCREFALMLKNSGYFIDKI